MSEWEEVPNPWDYAIEMPATDGTTLCVGFPLALECDLSEMKGARFVRRVREPSRADGTPPAA